MCVISVLCNKLKTLFSFAPLLFLFVHPLLYSSPKKKKKKNTYIIEQSYRGDRYDHFLSRPFLC